MAYPNHQIENLLTEVQTQLQTYEPTGYFSLAKVFKLSEDEANLDQAIKDEPQGRNLVFFLIPLGGGQDEAFSEDFRFYDMQILFKYNEMNLGLARTRKHRVFDSVRDIFWRRLNKQPPGTYYYNVEQVGQDDYNPAVTEQTDSTDGNLESGKIIQRGSQTWRFYTCIDHQVVNLSEVKTGTAESGERI